MVAPLVARVCCLTLGAHTLRLCPPDATLLSCENHEIDARRAAFLARPVRALEKWLAVALIDSGPIFRRIDRHSHIFAERLSGEAASLVVAKRVETAGLEKSYSGHSLRAGLATSASLAGVPSYKIRAQTGHASDAMLNRYIRDSELFIGNASGAIL